MTRKKRAKELLENLKDWMDVIEDKKLVTYIEREMNITYLEGITDGLKKAL